MQVTQLPVWWKANSLLLYKGGSSKYSDHSKWPDLMVSLRKTRQIELTKIHPQHVACAWLGNSEDVAKKHYLKVTDGHMAAGSLLTASQKSETKSGSKRIPW